MIETRDLSYHYPGGSRVIDCLNLRLGAGVCGLLGENGVGKSTLLGLLSGRLRPEAGTVALDGEDITRREPLTLSRIHLVPEELTLPPLSFQRYVDTLRPFYPRFDEATLNRVADVFEVDRGRRLNALSSGQRKKAVLSVALALGVDLLLLDEPTNTLDIPSKTQFRQALAGSVREGSTVMISTHQVHDVEALLDHVTIMDRRQVLLDSPVADLAERLHFGLTDDPGGCLYSEPTIGGLAAIRPRQGDEEETPINLEVLFNAVIKGKINITQ